MIEFEDKIYDDIHGFIEITELEQELIKSPYFQRLKEIKQLGLTYFVFPGANHTRFSHSLGVMEIAAKMVENIIKNTSKLKKMYHSRENGDEIEKIIKKLRVAALLHDIGHYPLSHLIESVYMKHGKELRVKKMEDEIFGAEAGANSDSKVNSDGEHHEEISGYIIRNTDYHGGITKILKKEFSREDINDIANIVRGNSTTIWYNNIINSELDADRLDYLLRDSYETGVIYGNVDLDYLLTHLKLEKANGKDIVVVEDSAVFSVDHFLLARYFWYAQIINERDTAIFNKMAKMLYKHFIDLDHVFSIKEIKENIADGNNYRKYLQFNDHYFWNKIYNFKADNIDKETEGYYFELSDLLNDRIPLSECNFIDITKSIKNKNSKKEVENNKNESIKLLKDYKAQIKKIVASEEEKWIIDVLGGNVLTNCNHSFKAEEDNDIDSVKILSKNGDLKSIFSVEHSLGNRLSNIQLLIPRIYMKEEIYQKYRDKIDKIELK